MPIDPAVAIGAETGEVAFSWTSSDVLLYHLGIGASTEELQYAYERNLVVLPAFAAVAAKLRSVDPPALSFPGIQIALAKVLHGKQEVTLHQSIPVAGKAVARSRVADVQDKGTAAVVVQETEVVGADGSPLWTARSSLFVRGEGGFGGTRGASDRIEWPSRQPDVVVETPTLPQQALLYRLSGDRNPLHVDPEFARAAGFRQPILHGLCTYGIVCRILVGEFLDGDPSRVRSFAAKFAGAVFPGETLRTRVWRDGSRLLVTTTSAERADAPVLSDTILTFS